MNDQRAKWEERYRTGPTPWDTGITPPEVIDFWTHKQISPGDLALDIGSGTATNAIFLAQQGLTVLGFDLAGGALRHGKARLQYCAPALQARVSLIQADVSMLPISAAGAIYALDIGCFHGLNDTLRPYYTKCIGNNLRRGGYYHLYAFDRLPEELHVPDARGVRPNEIEERFTQHFDVVEIQEAIPNPRPCRWYLLQRR
jgi:SAM-dependent methyltransferase